MAKIFLAIIAGLLLVPVALATVSYNTSSWSRDWETAASGSELSISLPNIKVPVTFVSFVVEKAISNASLAVQLPEKTVEGPYDIVIAVELVPINIDSPANIKARFRVENSVMSNVSPENIKLYYAKDWSQVKLTMTSQDKTYAYYVADLPSFGLYAFTAAKTTEPVKNETASKEEVKEQIKEPPKEEAKEVPKVVPAQEAAPKQEAKKEAVQPVPGEKSALSVVLFHPITLVIGGLVILILIINIIYKFTNKEEPEEREEHAEVDDSIMKLKPLHEREAMERQKWPYIDKRKSDRRAAKKEEFPLQNLVDDVDKEKK